MTKREMLVSILCLPLLWVLFVGDFQAQELMVGTVCVIATASFCHLIFGMASDHIQFSLLDILQIRRVPGTILGDTVRVVALLGRDLFTGRRTGSYYVGLRCAGISVSKSAGDRGLTEEAQRMGREVLAVSYISASPNSIVLSINMREQFMLVHQLQHTPPSKLAQAFGAQSAAVTALKQQC